MIHKKTIGRYLNVYICIGFLFATYSFVLDIVYYLMYRSQEEYFGAMGGYLLLYFVFFYISLPIAFYYNAIVNILPKKKEIKILFGVLAGAAGAAIFELPSYYGGSNGLKTLIVMTLVGFSIEVIRIQVVKKRARRKSELFLNSP